MRTKDQEYRDDQNGHKMRVIRAYARNHYGGHFCILSFTNGYKGCYGTPCDFRHAVNNMPEYKSFSNLLMDMVTNPKAFDIKNFE